MAKKKEPAEGNKGIAEGALRELGLGNLVDFALKSPVFKQRFREVNQQVEERLSREIAGGRRPSTRLGIRPHIESNYFVRYIREEKSREWKPALRKPRKPVRGSIRKIVAGEQEIEPLVDVFDENDHLRIVAELPGVQESDIRTEVKGDKLTISAGIHNRKYHKEVPLHVAVEAEPTKLTYKNGILEIKLKKKLRD